MFENKKKKEGQAAQSQPPSTTNPVSQGIDEGLLSYIAGVLARDHSVKVSIGAPGEQSSANTETKEIILNPDNCQTPSMARFIAAHEGAHIGETLSLKALGKSPEEMKGIVKKLGFIALRNVIEDGAINDRAALKYPNLQPDILSAYPRTASHDPLGILIHPEVVAVASILGRPPLFAQALAGLLADWSELRHQKGFGRSVSELQKLPRQGGSTTDADILKFFKHALKESRDAISMTPAPNDNADVSAMKSEERFIWVEKVLYPLLSQLVERDIKDLKQKIQDGQNSKNSKQSDKQERKNPQEGPPSSQQGGSQPSEDGEAGDNSDKQSGGSSASKDQKTKDGSKPSKNKPQKDKSRDESAEETEEGKTDKDAQSGQEEPTQEEMTDTEAERRAKESLARADDAIRELLESLKEKAEDPIPSASQVIGQENDMERQTEAAEQAARDGASLSKKLGETLLKNLPPYLAEYHEIAQSLEEAHNRLIDIFDPERHFRWTEDLASGTKVKMINAMRFELTGEGHERLWMKRIDPRQPDFDLVVIVDRSGSMESDDKFVYARRAVIFARELFQRLNIPTACVGFGNSSRTFLDFEDDVSEPETQQRVMGSTNPLNEGTHDADAIKHAAALLRERSASKRAIVMISDAGSGQGDELKDVVRKLEADEGIPVLHFGIGEGTEDHAGNYIHSKGGLTLTGMGSNGFLNVFCREMELLAAGALDEQRS